MKTILVTAFEPFGGDGINPTELILSRLPGELEGVHISKLLLPVEFMRAPELALKEIGRLSPAAVIMLGQAGGRSAVTPETTAYNLMEARIPDNAGYEPHGTEAAPGGEAEIPASLPAERIVEAIRALGLPAELSHDPGRYVCNALMYSVLRSLRGSIPAGFIHVPFIRVQTEGVKGRGKTPFMELDDICRAILEAISVTARLI